MRRYITNILMIAPVKNFIMGQRIQWFGHIMRREENKTGKSSIGMEFTR